MLTPRVLHVPISPNTAVLTGVRFQLPPDGPNDFLISEHLERTTFVLGGYVRVEAGVLVM